MNINPHIKKALGGMLAIALALGVVLTTAQPAAAQYAVPGAPGVADVSVVQGDVVIVRGDSGAQVGATINAPLLPGDYITTGGGSRAEVQFDGVSMLRLAQNTQVRFVNLSPSSREVQLASGTAELAELQGADGNPQIDTPSLSMRPDQTGDYRVSVLGSGQTLVTVRSGMATIYTGSGSQNLTQGSTLVADGPYNAPSISVEGAIAYDAFDNFNVNRDQTIVTAYNSNPDLSPALAGYANFSNYGQWYNVPGYGEAWAPYNQSANWAPYSNGQWVWEPGYGYTWVGNEPWGYVPYHYGSWFYDTGYNQWMWQPPAYQYQNASALSSAWLPAMVAFFLSGGNPGAGLGYAYNPAAPYGYGGIGWVPLAPGEQYTPWYAGFGPNAIFPQTALSPVTNVTNIYNVYRNIRYVKVVRVIRVDRFRNGDFSHPVLLSTRSLRNIALVRGTIPVVPTKALLAPARAKTTIALSSRFHDPVFAAKTSSIANVASFDRQVTALHSVVARKPAVVNVPAHVAAAAHPVYRAPATHETFHAPVQVTHQVAPHFATPAHATAPATEQLFVPEHVTAPKHATTPEHATAPQRSTTPERLVPSAHPAAAVERPATTTEHTAAPQRFAPEQSRVVPQTQRVAPQRAFTPLPKVERTMVPQRRAGAPAAPNHAQPGVTATPQHQRETPPPR